ncbi:hypothetical protein [Paracoccus sp. N5]|nr:hypothetical protein [Paracoccus sp. N5]
MDRPPGDGLNPFMDERSRTARLMVDLVGSAMERKVDAQLPT